MRRWPSDIGAPNTTLIHNTEVPRHMYEETRLTVSQLIELLSGLPGDAQVAGTCCSSSSVAHPAHAVEFDDVFTNKRVSIPAYRQTNDEHGNTLIVLNLDDDYVTLEEDD